MKTSTVTNQNISNMEPLTVELMDHEVCLDLQLIIGRKNNNASAHIEYLQLMSHDM